MDLRREEAGGKKKSWRSLTSNPKLSVSPPPPLRWCTSAPWWSPQLRLLRTHGSPQHTALRRHRGRSRRPEINQTVRVCEGNPCFSLNVTNPVELWSRPSLWKDLWSSEFHRSQPPHLQKHWEEKALCGKQTTKLIIISRLKLWHMVPTRKKTCYNLTEIRWKIRGDYSIHGDTVKAVNWLRRREN